MLVVLLKLWRSEEIPLFVLLFVVRALFFGPGLAGQEDESSEFVSPANFGASMPIPMTLVRCGNLFFAAPHAISRSVRRLFT